MPDNELSPLGKLLADTHGKGTAIFKDMDAIDISALLAHGESKAGVARHLGVARSTASDSLGKAGITDVVDARVVASARYPELTPSVLDDDYDPGLDTDAKLDHYRREHKRQEVEIAQLRQAYSIVQDIINVEVDQLPTVTPRYKHNKSTTVDEELCELHISDVHIGEWVQRDETAGLSEYDWDVVLERKARLMERFDSILNGHVRPTYPVNHCFVNIYGDIVTGENIFRGQASRVDQRLLAQIVRGAHEMADLLRWLASMFETVTVYAVPGNHGRVFDTTLNTDVVLYLMMQAALADQENVRIVISDTSPFLGYFIDESLGILDWSKGGRRHNYILAHGNQVTAYKGIPYYGLNRLKANLDSMFKIVWDRFTCGHFHTEGSSENWLMIPSWVGATEYTVGKLQAASRPAQLMNGFHPRQGTTWQYTLWLDDEVGLTEPVDGSNIYTPYNQFDRDEEPVAARGTKEKAANE